MKAWADFPIDIKNDRRWRMDIGMGVNAGANRHGQGQRAADKAKAIDLPIVLIYCKTRKVKDIGAPIGNAGILTKGGKIPVLRKNIAGGRVVLSVRIRIKPGFLTGFFGQAAMGFDDVVSVARGQGTQPRMAGRMIADGGQGRLGDDPDLFPRHIVAIATVNGIG